MGTPENSQSQINDITGDIPFDCLVDAVGMSCPLPLLKMKQALNKAKVDEVVHVKATDSGSKRDFSAYIKMTNHELVSKEVDGTYLYWITKKE